MWAPADECAMPSAQDIIQAKIVIRQLEEELTQAHLRVKQLTEELEKRRAWISPVRRLPFDILSLVFEICGEEEWKSPLRISGVCRMWRDAALATPRAWSFIDTRQEEDFNLIRLFFERSGERLLHIGLSSKIRHEDLPEEFTRKIQCLSIGQFFFGTPLGRIFSTPTEKSQFPNVSRLRVRQSRSGVRFSDITNTIFPSLRHLEMVGALDDEPRIPPPFDSLVFPPLETLKLAVRHNEAWLRVIEGCSNSLISLYIRFIHFHLSGPCEIRLPRLKCLEVNKFTDGDNPSILTFITPSLATYIEMNAFQDPGMPLHLDVASVMYMRFDQVPALSVLPQIRFLQLDLSFHAFRTFFDQLVAGPHHCSLLETVEFRFLGESRFTAGEENEPIEMGRNIRPNVTILVTTDKWSRELPGFITSLVGILVASAVRFSFLRSSV